MDRFQHKMRTTQHAKSVEMIMTRTNYQFFSSKTPRKKPSTQGENITTYLRKFQIEKQNLNLAKRILQCQSQHSKDKYVREWQKVKQFLRVRSNFKKTLYAKQPQIFKFEPILGKGRLKVDFVIKNVELHSSQLSKKNLFKFSFVLGNSEVEPDQKLITADLITNYSTCFYAPLFLKKKKISCKLFQIRENNQYEVGRFHLDLGQESVQEVQVFNKLGKNIGMISLNVHVQGGRRKLKKKNFQDKQNIQPQDESKSITLRQTYFSGPPI